MATILIADESPQIRRNLTLALQREGFDIVLAETGLEALNFALHRRPNLAIIDPDLRGLDGIELLNCLKVNPPTAGMPVVFMSTALSTTLVNKALDAGAIDYLGKPLDSDHLLQRINRILAEKVARGRVVTLAMDDCPSTYSAMVDEVYPDRLHLRKPEWQLGHESFFQPGSQGEIHFSSEDKTLYRQRITLGRILDGKYPALEAIVESGVYRSQRRQHFRKAVQLPLRYRIGESFFRVGQVEDVSGGGLRLSNVTEDAKPGQTISLELKIPPKNDVLSLQGAIVWSQGGSIGVAFAEIDPQAQVSLIMHLFGGTLRQALKA